MPRYRTVTLDLSMTEKQLYGSQIAGASIDQRRLGSAKRMSAEEVRIQTNASNPL